jgi:hypothetical protein
MLNKSSEIMKKIYSLIVMACISLMGFGQAIVDNAVIPVSVSVNSIMRMNVVSGGAIEFAVSTMGDFTAGINNNGTESRYHTVFTVASSVDFIVSLEAEDGTFMGANGNTLALNYVGFTMSADGTGAFGADPSNYLTISHDGSGYDDASISPTIVPLDNSSLAIVTSNTGLGAGDATKNKFSIKWELATTNLASKTSNPTLAASSITPDRYTTNVFLTLTEKP